MIVEACAKVNLTLEVLGVRSDGYHALRSVVMPVGLADTLEVEATENGEVVSDSPYPDDLCVKAGRILRKRCPGAEGARIRIVKRIPAGGGLGGGSADAAAVLRALNGLWACGLSTSELAELGAAVGSDVPALVFAQTLRAPVLMEGRGEKVAALFLEKVEPVPIVLVNPGVFSSTPEVFRHAESRANPDESILERMRAALLSGDPRAVAAALQNDLEKAAEALHPEIAAAKSALLSEGALGALMTGSGSTVFGLARSPSDAQRLASRLAKRYPLFTVHCPLNLL